jgi:hypothetical protein
VVEPFSAEVNAMEPADAVRVTAQSLLSVWERAGLSVQGGSSARGDGWDTQL